MNSYYMMMRTTTGRKYRVRIAENEDLERMLYRIAVVVLPFVASAGMFWLWVKMG